MTILRENIIKLSDLLKTLWQRRPWTISCISVLIVWLVVAGFYTFNTTYQIQNDVYGHLEYTHILHQEKVFPSPYRAWQTYHPPAFYIVAQLFNPGNSHQEVHLLVVRTYIFLILGSIFVLSMLYVLEWFGLPPGFSALAITYILTIPSIVFHFTSYNNDGQATAIICLVAALSLAFLSEKRIAIRPILGAVIILYSSLAVYTKYTALFALASFIVLVVGGVLIKKIALNRGLILVTCYFLGIVTLAPWLILHNWTYTGKLFPHNVESQSAMPFASMEGWDKVSFFLKPPAISNEEWATPFVYKNGLNWTKKTIWSSAFVTSLFNEWDFTNTNPSIAMVFRNIPLISTLAWLIVWIQLGIFYCLMRTWSRKSLIPFLAFFLAFLTNVYQLIFIQSFMNAANFRYYVWSVIPFAILIVLALQNFASRKNQKWYLPILKGLLYSGIFFHIAFIVVIATDHI